MEWNGMEWNGMGWHGLEWNGMEWDGMAWNGMDGKTIPTSRAAWVHVGRLSYRALV